MRLPQFVVNYVDSVVSSNLLSNISTNIVNFIIWRSLETFSLPSILLIPIFHLAMTSITERIQKILRSSINSDVCVGRENRKLILSSETENRLKLRDLLEDQHRMMYYTVTISTVPTLPEHIVRRKTSNLKWQNASTLCKTQATMRKSTVKYPTYYTITYLGDLIEDDQEVIDNDADIEHDIHCTPVRLQNHN